MILVTGADGYVGASIVQKLNNQKEKTLLIMRKNPERLKVDKKLNKVIFIPNFFSKSSTLKMFFLILSKPILNKVLLFLKI